ncbi:hypothetical protein N7493_005842 [Penicillium malachiteum]|uniref:Protein kinase domain-containing protein n=1 Tax=Penicillium malachiteum TaxID=1324776 RepID=A0AAD6HLK8_9EURO|nr:hypothetical protein N7493_005842 [Penicillium malachiteum]
MATCREGAYVAVKILIAEAKYREMREIQIMQELASHHARPKHMVHLLDNLEIKSPNGFHACLVFELLGPNIPDTIDARFPSGRLPGELAKAIAKQSLIGLDVLHQNGIGHGDLHTRNLAFTLPYLGSLTEAEFMEMLGKPEIGHIRRHDGKLLESGIPKYVVKPTSHLNQYQNSAPTIKIIDFGQSFYPLQFPKHYIPRYL